MTAAGLYLHLPFCSAICPYCDFAVTTAPPARRQRFVTILRQEIAQVAGRFAGVAFDTVYFGGGTPSLHPAEDLAALVAELGARFPLLADTRLFLEANPEDVDAERLAAWRALGVGTLSLGVQSFADAELAFLGRRHDAVTARRAVELALAAGFATVSIDLIYGLPGQTRAAWEHSLRTAIALAPGHVSCYELEVHERTAFGKRQRRGELCELPEERQAELFFYTHERLAEAGYPAYEVSNFAASPLHRSRHNRKYWDHTPYLGVGPSAHSFAGQQRWWNERHVARWETKVLAGEDASAGSEELRREELALEALMLGLRTPEGVDLGRFRERYGVDLAAHNRELLERQVAAGLLYLDGDRLSPTLRGLAVADGLAARFTV